MPVNTIIRDTKTNLKKTTLRRGPHFRFHILRNNCTSTSKKRAFAIVYTLREHDVYTFCRASFIKGDPFLA